MSVVLWEAIRNSTPRQSKSFLSSQTDQSLQRDGIQFGSQSPGFWDAQPRFKRIELPKTREKLALPCDSASDQCFARVLRACDYEFIDLFVAAYKRWLSDPQSHLQGLLQDSPELLPLALDSLQKVPEQLVQLRRGA